MELQINSLETKIEKMQEMFSKDLEEIKNSQLKRDKVLLYNTGNYIQYPVIIIKNMKKHVCVYMCVCVYVNVYVYMYMHICVCVYIYMYINK